MPFFYFISSAIRASLGAQCWDKLQNTEKQQRQQLTCWNAAEPSFMCSFTTLFCGLKEIMLQSMCRSVCWLGCMKQASRWKQISPSIILIRCYSERWRSWKLLLFRPSTCISIFKRFQAARVPKDVFRMGISWNKNQQLNGGTLEDNNSDCAPLIGREADPLSQWEGGHEMHSFTYCSERGE